jgi:mono/diheme cytochrome c family protein
MKMTPRIIVFGSVVVFAAVVLATVFIPAKLWNPEQTVVAHSYTERQGRGRVLFYSNGCNYCHTQYVRAEDTAMGPVSEGGNYVFDNPMILGSERTGPDLSYVGRKRSEQWEIDHLKSPRDFSPLSIMPRFEFLGDEALKDIAAYLFALGDRVAQVRMIPSPAPYAQKTNNTTIMVSPGNGVGWPTWIKAGLQHGKEIYIERCLTCHGCAGNGLGTYAGTLVVTPANFKQQPFKSMPQDQWFWHVSEGVPGTVMPPWRESESEEDRWAVIHYVRTVFARPAMHDPDEGDPTGDYAGMTNPLPLNMEVLDQGKTIFTRECLVCHGDAGRGNGPYRSGLQPTPPDFGDGSYGTLDKPVYSDADYFWRISVGVPWTAMPTWKLHYSEQDRWALVHYVRALLTQTEVAPPIPKQEFNFPEIYKRQRFPETVNMERGKAVYAEHCAHCHGLALDGKGWDGQGLKPVPADLRTMGKEKMTPESQGEHLAKVTFGIHNSAMPAWGEFLPESQRWDAIKYLMSVTMMGLKKTDSQFEPNRMNAVYLTVSRDMWINDAGMTIDKISGGDAYATYCATCHGAQGKGDGPGTADSKSPGPSAFPQGMSDGYVYWRMTEGISDSTMPGFTALLDDRAIWNITAWVVDNLSAKKEGN